MAHAGNDSLWVSVRTFRCLGGPHGRQAEQHSLMSIRDAYKTNEVSHFILALYTIISYLTLYYTLLYTILFYTIHTMFSEAPQCLTKPRDFKVKVLVGSATHKLRTNNISLLCEEKDGYLINLSWHKIEPKVLEQKCQIFTWVLMFFPVYISL